MAPRFKFKLQTLVNSEFDMPFNLVLSPPLTNETVSKVKSIAFIKVSKYQANLVKSLQSDLKVADSFIAALLTVVEIENPMFGILHA